MRLFYIIQVNKPCNKYCSKYFSVYGIHRKVFINITTLYFLHYNNCFLYLCRQLYPSLDQSLGDTEYYLFTSSGNSTMSRNFPYIAQKEGKEHTIKTSILLIDILSSIPFTHSVRGRKTTRVGQERTHRTDEKERANPRLHE